MTEKNWYALRSKPRKELALYEQVRARNIELFFPKYRTHAVNPRAAKMRPYFPGYLFVHVDTSEYGMSAFQWMPYSLGLVEFDGEPGLIPTPLIGALKRRIVELEENGEFLQDEYTPGATLKIVAGLFKGYDAIFDSRLDGADRVRILLQLMDSRQMPVELCTGQIAHKT